MNTTQVPVLHERRTSGTAIGDRGLPWLPGGARGSDKLSLKNRQQYLMAVRLAGALAGAPPWMDWHIVEVANDEDGFMFHSNGWVWRWEDVEWCLPLASLKLPEAS